MSERRNDTHRDRRHSELEALYRAAGDVEPDSGLDRIIRARADEALRDRRSSNLRPWLSGLIAASVAVMAIAVVLQQTPPGEQTPAAPARPKAEETGAFMAPSMGADAALDSAPETLRERGEAREMQASANPAEAEPAPPPARLSDPPQSLARQQRVTESNEMESNDEVGGQSAIAAGKARAVSEDAVGDADAVLERIAGLIERDEFQRARALLKEFRRNYPDRPVPADIEDSLESAAPRPNR